MKSTEIKKRIKELDTLLDSDITDAEFDKIEYQIQRLYKELSEEEKKEKFFNIKETKPTEWEKNFLSSFSIGTRVITVRQYQILRRIGKYKEYFRIGQTLYEFSINSTFGHLVVTTF